MSNAATIVKTTNNIEDETRVELAIINNPAGKFSVTFFDEDSNEVIECRIFKAMDKAESYFTTLDFA